MIFKKHKTLEVSAHVTPVYFGRTKETRDEDGEVIEEELVKSIDEYTFYFIFCSINNITAENKLANTQLAVLSALLSKPLDFSLPIDSKDGKLSKLAKELSTDEKSRTANSIYQAVKRLRETGYLLETEDKLIVPNALLQRVRQIVKRELAVNGGCSFDYLFKCYIKE